VKADVEIRRMIAADLDQVLAIAGSLAEAPHWPGSAYLKAIDSQATPRRIALVATGAGLDTILGFAVARLLVPQAELESIAVAKSHQRVGLGQQLLQCLIGELKAAGANEVLLEVRSSNHLALAFYRSLGFIQVGLRPSYYKDPLEDAILMRLPLA
jgi:[ribosomal protein S18]-alanine N-acetyltransferase